jgi:hypothetical protein
VWFLKVKTKPINYSDLYNGIEIDIPITDKTKPAFTKSNLTNLWRAKVTIYNDISATEIENRHFDRFVIDNCSIQGGRVSKEDGTIENVVNAQTVWTKDVTHYREPREYMLLPVDERENFYTVQIGDFVVLSEVEDIVENAKDFATLQSKYANHGFKITSISPNINGMSVDNISFTNA